TRSKRDWSSDVCSSDLEYPLPIVAGASLSPDGSRIAYVPHPQWQRAWKRYRGGQTTPIWVADLKDSRIEKVPRENSNDFNPMWRSEERRVGEGCRERGE